MAHGTLLYSPWQAMQIEFRCPQCKTKVTLDPALPGKCGKCHESFAGDQTYAGAIATVTQCAVCRGSQIVDRSWSQRYVGPGFTVLALLLIIPTRGFSLLAPMIIKWVLDYFLPKHRVCKDCACVYAT